MSKVKITPNQWAVLRHVFKLDEEHQKLCDSYFCIRCTLDNIKPAVYYCKEPFYYKRQLYIITAVPLGRFYPGQKFLVSLRKAGDKGFALFMPVNEFTETQMKYEELV